MSQSLARSALLSLVRPLFVAGAMSAALLGFAANSDVSAAPLGVAQCAAGGSSDASPSIALGCTMSGEPAVALAGTASADPADPGPVVVGITAGGDAGGAAAGVIDVHDPSVVIAGGVGGSDGYAASSGVLQYSD